MRHAWKSDRFKPQYKHEPQQEHDYVTPPQSLPSHHHSEAETLELKACNDTQEEKDKDYYFVDTTDIGHYFNSILL